MIQGIAPSWPLRTSWTAGWTYLLQGFEVTRRQPALYAELVLFYSLPSLAAAWLVLYGPSEALWQRTLVFTLPWITVAVAPAVVMLAVKAGLEGQQIGILEATRRGIRWLPRYVWTNAHTSIVFWIPVGGLHLVRANTPLGVLLPDLVWSVIVGSVAIHQHVRTLMAPYLAIHGDMNGTRAAITSWRLGGAYFWPLLGTFVLGAAPVALPLASVYVLAEAFGPEWLRWVLVVTGSQLTWVFIQAVRPVLIPALHSLYEDLQGEPSAVQIARVIPAIRS